MLKHLLSLLVVAILPSLASAQGIIIPPERVPIWGSYAVRNVTLDASVKDQIAEVQVSQVFRNLSSREMEVVYIFPTPPDATINQFTLMIDGQEVPAKIYTKEEARRIYEGIVRTRRDPALLEYVGYGAVQTSVFPLPPNGERKISLRYSQLCRRDRDVTELLFPLTSGKLSSKPIEELRVTVRIDNPLRIKSVYCPTFPIGIERPSENSAIVRYTQNNLSPSEDLRLFWSLSDKPIGASLLTYRPDDREDGYFLLLASPEVKSEGKVTNKTIVFALDRSGSMAGQKIEQARNALKFVLNNLREGDTFNLIAFDDRIETFKPELQRYDNESRAQAMRFIDNIHDGGSTNIDGALKRALELVGDTGRPSYVIFLTDGLPTAGETNESAIATNAKNTNHGRARLFTFGLGFDVNARLLDRLTTDNGGSGEYVRPNENIESSVAKFYGKMTAPVLTGVRMELAGAEVNRVYPRDLPDLFAGGQIIAVGRYRTAGPANIRLSGRVGDVQQTFEFPASLVGRSGDDNYGFVEKLWASRRIGEILNELDLKGRNQELIDELVRLSTRHGILTPYTSFLADERTRLHATGENAKEAERFAFDSADSFKGNVTGQRGVELRRMKQEFQNTDQVNQWAVNGGVVSGGGGARGGPSAPSAPMSRPGTSGNVIARDAEGNDRQVLNVQVVGNKALYRRSNRWVDPTVTPEDEKKAEQVEQFSDRYFELARNNARLRQYLSLPDGCTVRMDGKVYQINAQQNRGG